MGAGDTLGFKNAATRRHMVGAGGHWPTVFDVLQHVAGASGGVLVGPDIATNQGLYIVNRRDRSERKRSLFSLVAPSDILGTWKI